MLHQVLQKIKDVHEQSFVTVFYITPNNQIKSVKVYKDSKIFFPHDELYTSEDLAIIENDFMLKFNNNYLFKVDEPSHIIGVWDCYNDSIYHSSGDFTYSGITPLEMYSFYSYSSSYIPEYLEESDFRPANTLTQVFCEFQVVNP